MAVIAVAVGGGDRGCHARLEACGLATRTALLVLPLVGIHEGGSLHRGRPGEHARQLLDDRAARLATLCEAHSRRNHQRNRHGIINGVINGIINGITDERNVRAELAISP